MKISRANVPKYTLTGPSYEKGQTSISMIGQVLGGTYVSHISKEVNLVPMLSIPRACYLE
jgi:hypothetical protein